MASTTDDRHFLRVADQSKPVTQHGDILLNLHPDRVEVVSPGPLPLGVTPQNLLYTNVRRNEHLARLFHALKPMERDGKP